MGGECSAHFSCRKANRPSSPPPQAEAAAASAASSGRRAALTKAELEAAPPSAPLHVAVGRAFVSADRAAVLSDLDAATAAAASDAAAATTAAKNLRAKVVDVEGELRELLESSPALAAAAARG